MGPNKKNIIKNKIQYIIINVGEGKHIKAPVEKNYLKEDGIIGIVDIIFIQSLTHRTISINRSFKFKGNKILPSYDGCCMQFQPSSSTTSFFKEVDSIDDFEFDFVQHDIIMVTFYLPDTKRVE